MSHLSRVTFPTFLQDQLEGGSGKASRLVAVKSDPTAIQNAAKTSLRFLQQMRCIEVQRLLLCLVFRFHRAHPVHQLLQRPTLFVLPRRLAARFSSAGPNVSTTQRWVCM